MNDFTSTKFRVKSTKIVPKCDNWFDEIKYVEKPEFGLTSSYAKYLDEKRKEILRDEVRILKAKLEYEYKTYGEVDSIDFQEYVCKLNKLNSL